MRYFQDNFDGHRTAEAIVKDRKHTSFGMKKKRLYKNILPNDDSHNKKNNPDALF